MEETTNKSGMSAGMVVGIAVIVAILFGGGVYAYVNNKAEKEKKALNAQITELQSQVSSVKTATTTAPTSSTSKTADATAGWKNYKDDENGFSFKYPSEWGDPKVSTDGPSTDPVEVKGYSNKITFPSSSEKSVTVGFSTTDFSAPRHANYWEQISKQIASTCNELEKSNQVIVSGSCVANGKDGFMTKFDWFGDKPIVGVIYSGISKYPVFTVSPAEIANQAYADSITRQVLSSFQFTK